MHYSSNPPPTPLVRGELVVSSPDKGRLGGVRFSYRAWPFSAMRCIIPRMRENKPGWISFSGRGTR